MPSKSHLLYEAHHTAFETWFTGIHPDHTLTFEWESVWDSGWYKEDMANGAWITWLELTGKRANSNSHSHNEPSSTNSEENLRTIKCVISPETCRAEEPEVYRVKLKEKLEKACPRTSVDVMIANNCASNDIIVSGFYDKDNEVIEAIKYML